MKQEMMGWQCHQLEHTQIICILLLQTEPCQHLIAQFFPGRMLFLRSNQQRQSTEVIALKAMKTK